jgi:hypothetical protein
MVEGATSVLFQYGLAGVVIFGLSWVCWALYRENQKLHEKIYALQESRREDAKETIDKVTQPLSGISQTINLLYDKIVVSKQKVG